ncbi:MAG: AlbA family DNA-binding domain-containing protein [Chitinophagaceae bacterium]
MKKNNRHKEYIYNMLTDYNKDTVAKFLKNSEFETAYVDFKREWIKQDKLAKILLAMANSGGGLIFIGIAQEEDGTIDVCGLKSFCDDAKIRQSVQNYIPAVLSFDIENYSYDTSEYEKLKDKKIQLVRVKSSPKHLPYLSTNEGADIKNNSIYIRHGTICALANNTDIQTLIDARIQTNFISQMDLDTHLYQLKKLYHSTHHNVNDYLFGNSRVPHLTGLNLIPRSPANTEFNNYINSLIKQKQQLIESVLGIDQLNK